MKDKKQSTVQERERSNRQLSDLKAIIESPGTPLPRLSKAELAELRGSFRNLQPELEQLDPILALRYSLALNLPVPDRSFRTEAIGSALTLEDLIKLSPKLTPKIRVPILMPYMGALAISINRLRRPLTPGDAKSIKRRMSSMRTLLKDQRHDVSAEEAAVELNKLARAIVANLNLKTDKDCRSGEALAKDLLGPSLASMRPPSTPARLLSGLEIINSISSKFGSMFMAQQIEGHLSAKALQSATEGLVEQVRKTAQMGQLRELQELVRTAKGSPLFQDTLTAALTSLWHNDAAQLDMSTQDVIRSELGLAGKGREATMELVDESEKMEVTLMASALLKAWDAKDDGPKAALAFRSLSETVSKLYNIRLGGTVRSTADFDPNLFEWVHDKRSKRPRIVRPWVEWNAGKNWRVLIKGLVDAKSE